MEELYPNGDFKAEITLEGGTGRTTVQSPANVHIEDGVITAEIVWNSQNYDLMIVDGEEYKPISNEDGQSVFRVVIPSLDKPLDIKAETVAMSAPHLIEYTITVSGKEILKREGDSESESSIDIASMTSEELQSFIDSVMANATPGSEVIFSATVGSPASGGSHIPPLAVVGISAALGAAVAFVAVSLGKNKKK